MIPDVAKKNCQALCVAINGFADGVEGVDFNTVLNSHNKLLRSYGGKTDDASRLAFKELKQTVQKGGNIKEAASKAVTAFEGEFITPPKNPVEKPVETPPKEPQADDKKGGKK